MNDPDDVKRAPMETGKRRYVGPALVVLGDVGAMTSSGGTAETDGSGTRSLS